MDREEAVLRELNLYPQWVRRNQAAPVPAETPPQAEVAPAVALNTTAALGRAIVAGGDDSREQAIGGMDWPQLKAAVQGCAACKLRSGCTQTVFGVGDGRARWLFVGEGPGADEDAQGEPFVGQAGKLLDNMLLAIRLRRGNGVYIANIVKCRPPGNRAPEADEVAACFPYLRRQIGLIEPKLIVALGKTAAAALLGTEAPLGSLRGRLHDFNGIPVIATYHPSYLLRTPSEKAKAWQDLCYASDTMANL